VIESYAELGDSKAIKRTIQCLPKAERSEVLDFDTLHRIGMSAEAITEAVNEVKRRIAELEGANHPNIHFPVRSVCEALKFLVKRGRKQEAARWFNKVVKGAKKWNVVEQGWTTSAVYTMFAEVVAVLDGQEAAREMIAWAQQDAQAEKRSDFGKGAVSAAIDMEADLGNLDEAIAKASKLRSATQRRMQLGTLLAKARRWKELRAVCSQAGSPEEAAELCWGIHFELAPA
jgi:hypothetical protein